MRVLPVVLALACVGRLSGQAWTQLPDFPGTARDDASAFAVDSGIFVGTGMEVGWGLTNDWYRFSLWTLSWQQVASLPSSPRQYCTTFTGIQGGYLFGGLTSESAVNELWLYNTVANTWSQKTSLPAEGRYACAAFTIGNKAYVITGMLDSGLPTNEGWQYDMSIDSWSQIASLPAIPRHRAAAATLDPMGTPYGYVLGGADSAFNALNDCWKYEPSLDQWTSIAPLPVPLYGADALEGFGAPILMCGASDDSTFHEEVYQYDWWADAWYLHASFEGGPRRGGVMAYGSLGLGAFFTFYGTGLDGSLFRHNDWYAMINGFGINEQSNPAMLLSPNPGRSYFDIKGFLPGQIEITDAQGSMIFGANALSDPHIEAGDWPGGLYIVNAIDHSGRTYRARWIKL